MSSFEDEGRLRAGEYAGHAGLPASAVRETRVKKNFKMRGHSRNRTGIIDREQPRCSIIKHSALTNLVPNSVNENSGSVLGTEKGKAKSIPLKGRFLCVYYLANAGIASLYSDASVTARCAAVAVTRRRGGSAEVVVQESIGWSTTCGILTAEIAAIAAALEFVQDAFEPEPQELPLLATKLRITIFTDSQLALEAIKAGNSARRGRDLLRRIAESFFALREKDIEVEFRWVPGHSGVCGNEQADVAAKAAASQAGGLIAPLARRVREADGLIKAIEQDRKRDSDNFDPEGIPG